MYDCCRPSQQESLQERLQREAAEFKQLQHDLPSQVRSHSRASSHSSSSYSGGNGTPQEGQQRKMGRRWQDESEGSEGAEDAEQPQQQRVQQQQDSDQDQGDQQQQEQQQKRSRWMQEDEDERLVAEVEEGEAPLGLTVSAAVDEELEELNRSVSTNKMCDHTAARPYKLQSLGNYCLSFGITLIGILIKALHRSVVLSEKLLWYL